MIIGAHSIIYAEDAERTRAFMRDVLGFPYVDVHEGWLIFKLPPGELGIHPIEASESGRHELYLMCEDIDGTMAELTAKGVEFVFRKPAFSEVGRNLSAKIIGGDAAVGEWSG